MTTQELIAATIDPEAREQLEIILFGRMARIREQQAQLDEDMEECLAAQFIMQRVKSAYLHGEASPLN